MRIPFAAPSRRPLTLVALLAASVRLVYLAAHARSPLFTVPVLDARYFHDAARALAEGIVHPGLTTGFRGALYPALLAVAYRASESAGIVLAQVAQHAAGVATAVAVAALARRVFSSGRAALAAGSLYALAPVPLFFEGELLAESLYLALFAALLLQVASPPAAIRLPSAALAGALLAAAAQLRPNAWLLLVALPFVGSRAERWRRAAVFTGSAGIVSALFALALAPITGELRVVPASSGVNLYLGNRRGADGLQPRPTRGYSHGESYRDSVEVYAEAEYARARTESAVATGAQNEASARDAFWRRKAVDELAADPWGRALLLARKSVVLVWNGEVPNNRAFAFAASETPLLAWLPGRFGLVFGLALVGVAAAPCSPGRNALLAGAALHAAGVVLFFVADRYRLPLYVPLAALAGGGVTALLEPAGRVKRWRRFALFAASAALAFVDWTGARGQLPDAQRDLYFRSIAFAESGDLTRALDDAHRASSLAPDDPYSALQVAATALALDRLDEAERALARAARLAPREPRVLNAAGLLYERRGDPARARELFLEALRIAPTFEPARRNTARLAGEPAPAQRPRRQ